MFCKKIEFNYYYWRKKKTKTKKAFTTNLKIRIHFQIDTHSYFVAGWDVEQIITWRLADDPKAIMTTYPRGAQEMPGWQKLLPSARTDDVAPNFQVVVCFFEKKKQKTDLLRFYFNHVILIHYSIHMLFKTCLFTRTTPIEYFSRPQCQWFVRDAFLTTPWPTCRNFMRTQC